MQGSDRAVIQLMTALVCSEDCVAGQQLAMLDAFVIPPNAKWKPGGSLP